MRLTWAALMAAMVATAAPARADEPTERQKEAAREQLKLGDEWLKKGNLDKAADAYRNADDIMGVPTTGIEVMRIELKRGHLKEAFEAATKTAHYPEKTAEPPPFGRARSEAREALATLKQRIPRMTIEVTGLDEGASAHVSLDDAPIDPSGEVILNPGPHQVVAIADGYLPQSANFEIAEGETKPIALALVKPKPKVVAMQPTYWPLVYAGFGVAGASLISAAVTGGLSMSDTATLRDTCREDGNCPASAQPTLDRAHALANASTALFVFAAAGLAVGTPALVLSLRAKAANAKPPPDAALGPLFDSQGRPALGALLTMRR